MAARLLNLRAPATLALTALLFASMGVFIAARLEVTTGLDHFLSDASEVDLAVILEAEDLDDLRDEIVSNQIHSAFYASPTKYFKYIESTLSISLPVSSKAAYSEVKPTRDIYVHNGGIANRLYIQKAGALARAEDGDLLPLDEN